MCDGNVRVISKIQKLTLFPKKTKENLCSVMICTSTCLVEGPGSIPGSGLMLFLGKGRWTYVRKDSYRYKKSTKKLFFQLLLNKHIILLKKLNFQLEKWNSYIQLLKCVWHKDFWYLQ